MASRVINRIEEGILALLLALMTVVTVGQVVARHLFNTSAPWAPELATHLFAWLVLFGVSYGIKVGAHIGIGALVELFPPRARRAVGLIVVLLCLAYVAIMILGSWNYLRTLYILGIPSEDIAVPLWIPFVILPVGLALAFLRLAEVAADIWRGQRVGFPGNRVADVLEHLDERPDDATVAVQQEEIGRLRREAAR
jgi:C4-dicarboxylate transporter, DctQ subunit